MADLVLPLKAVYFNAIKEGTKATEYRLVTPYWRRRLEGRSYDAIVLTLGYPRAGDEERRLRRPWRGFTIETIQHEHFGPAPVQVFAIDVRAP
jgi:hypothetical protein